MKMARTILASILFGTTIGAAHASQDFCYQPFNFVDVFRLTFIQDATTTCQSGAFCPNNFVYGSDSTNYRQPTNKNYAIPLVGGQVSGFGTNPTIGYVGLHGVNRSSFFDNHLDCTFTLSFGSSSIPSLSVSCDGGVPGIWTKTVTLRTISCTAPIPVAPPSAKALGQCPSDPSAC
jgi:hypothetical protein